MKAVTWMCFVLFLLLLPGPNPALTEEKRVYFKDGGELLLRPADISGQITAILWFFNKDMAVEWIKDKVEFTAYDPFNQRAELNLTTGEVRIRSVTKKDVGRFKVEINHVEQDQKFLSVLIEEVPQPNLIVKPVTCSSKSQNCTLSCNVKLTNTGPVSFNWSVNEGEWKEGVKDKVVFNNYTEEQRHRCRIINPLGHRDSLPCSDIFKKEEERPGVVVVVVVVIVIVIVLVIAAILICKFKEKQPISGCLSSLGLSRENNLTSQQTNGGTATHAELETLNK